VAPVEINSLIGPGLVGDSGEDTPTNECLYQVGEQDRTVWNERASEDFMLRMKVQSSRPVTIRPGKVTEPHDEIIKLPALQDLISEIEGTVGRYFKPGANSAYESVRDVSIRCVKSASKIYGEEAARREAEGFKWDPTKLASDQAEYEASGFNLAVMALKRQDSFRPQRLNLTRLLSLSAENPEMEHLGSLCKGIIVPKPEGYRPNAKCFREVKEVLVIQRFFCQWSNRTRRRNPLGTPVKECLTSPAAKVYDQPLHRSYKDTWPAIDKMLSDLHDKGLGFNLSKALLFRTESVH
jgi:hypothetical protein